VGCLEGAETRADRLGHARDLVLYTTLSFFMLCFSL
jgi:hypothetical protein